jgi:acyl carrier protein
MTDDTIHPVSLEQFCHLIATELHLDEAQVTPQAAFIGDLSVDSVRMVELMLKLEETDITIPFETAWEITTVADAYRCYVEGVGLPTEAPGDAAAGEAAADPYDADRPPQA